MIYVEPVDPAEFILSADKIREKLLARNLDEISFEEASNPEILDKKLEPISVLKAIQDEYYGELLDIWKLIPGRSLQFSKAYELPPLGAVGDLDSLQKAYKAASRRSLWEKVTRTNHKDIEEYKTMLRLYSESLLNVMFESFSQAVAKKSFR